MTATEGASLRPEGLPSSARDYSAGSALRILELLEDFSPSRSAVPSTSRCCSPNVTSPTFPSTTSAESLVVNQVPPARLVEAKAASIVHAVCPAYLRTILADRVKGSVGGWKKFVPPPLACRSRASAEAVQTIERLDFRCGTRRAAPACSVTTPFTSGRR